MNDSFSELKRRYVRLTEQELERLERWELPSVGEGQDLTNVGEQLGFFAPQSHHDEPSEDGLEELDPDELRGPVGLTAAELEEIRQTAYEEGLQQGLQEGRISGQQVGHAEGLEQGLQEGREKGFAEGMARAEQALAEQRQQLMGLMDNLANPARKLDAQLMAELRDMSCQIAEAVLYREVETSEQLILSLIHKGIQILPSRNLAIKVFLHGEDKQQVEALWSPDPQELDITLITDPELSRGDCRLVTESSQVEFSWQQRLAILRESLLSQPIPEPAPAPAVSDNQHEATDELGQSTVDSLSAAADPAAETAA